MICSQPVVIDEGNGYQNTVHQYKLLPERGACWDACFNEKHLVLLTHFQVDLWAIQTGAGIYWELLNIRRKNR